MNYTDFRDMNKCIGSGLSEIEMRKVFDELQGFAHPMSLALVPITFLIWLVVNVRAKKESSLGVVPPIR